MRPTPEDKDALRIMLQREDLSEWEAEFMESLQQWRGHWTDKQAQKFDDVWSLYYE